MSQQSLFSILRKGPLKICVLGSGNWGTAVAGLISENAAESYIFDQNVTMWVYDEPMDDGRMLSAHINQDHENSKYLPGFKLPENLHAEPDAVAAVTNADLLVFILPHQFVVRVANVIKGKIKPTARAITLVKGLHVEHGRPKTFSDVLERTLGVECSALSGANVAKDVAMKQFSESTIGFKDTDMAPIWQQLFDRPYFRVHTVPDVEGVQVCGAVKNLVALAAGFCDGLGMGTNTKSAIIRIGTEEMRLFASLFFDGVLEETFFDSSGFADVITTCFGGRNVRCAAEFVRRNGTYSWEDIESTMLGGMKMQGQLTCKEVHEVLQHHDLVSLFPLFDVTYQIAFNGADANRLFSTFAERPTSLIRKLADCSPSHVAPDLHHLRRTLKKGHETHNVESP